MLLLVIWNYVPLVFQVQSSISNMLESMNVFKLVSLRAHNTITISSIISLSIFLRGMFEVKVEINSVNFS